MFLNKENFNVDASTKTGFLNLPDEISDSASDKLAEIIAGVCSPMLRQMKQVILERSELKNVKTLSEMISEIQKNVQEDPEDKDIFKKITIEAADGFTKDEVIYLFSQFLYKTVMDVTTAEALFLASAKLYQNFCEIQEDDVEVRNVISGIEAMKDMKFMYEVHDKEPQMINPIVANLLCHKVEKILKEE